MPTRTPGRSSTSLLVGDHEDPAERQHRAVRPARIGRPQPTPVLALELPAYRIGQARPAPAGRRCRRSSGTPGPGPRGRADRSSPTPRPDTRAGRDRRDRFPPGSASGQAMPVRWGANRGAAASSRSRVWLGSPKLPGTWNASQPSSVRLPSNPGSSARWSGTHCSAALLMITSTGRSGRQSRRSWSSKLTRSLRCSAARSIISGEESTPMIAAFGQRSASDGRQLARSAPEIDDHLRVLGARPARRGRRTAANARRRTPGTSPDSTCNLPPPVHPRSAHFCRPRVSTCGDSVRSPDCGEGGEGV